MKMRYINFAFVSLWLLGFQYCRIHNYRDPTSYFFKPERAYRSEYSNTRILEAQRFIEEHAGVPSLRTNRILRPTEEAPRLCIGIPSFGQRPGMDDSLLHTLASLIDRLTHVERDTIYIAVLIVDNPPTKHPSFYTQQLTMFADEILGYDGHINRTKTVLPFDAGNLNPVLIPDTLSMKRKIDSDVALLVDACQSTQASYFALVEDDVVASKDWFARTLEAVAFLEEKRDKSHRDWLYLRLFYSETYLGWNDEEWMCYAAWIVSAYVFVVSCLAIATRFSAPGRPTTSWRCSKHFIKIYASVLSLWLPLTIALYFLAGRLTMQPMSPGVHQMSNYGCCTQALVFPKRHMEDLSHHLRDAEFELFPDQMIEILADREGLSKWALVPSAVQHVGRKSSSIAGGRTKPTWNFRFEKQQ
ncbi:integral membrane protein [Verticillium alfalfae VaMs.102]|uniref:Integral membrane protein n=1 Tax=Verticillium alfalfae (strain VaMs.102 / ATCC MYA-4576 / FGSC 10136) TaxID=526221 RepID=C9SDU1_VERA1|nr:integral membrane protein [Verticillium alfalfae VaMs.102]EEY17211.1 integral membrane protein [Verticillium alfalfae VaMs.102]